MMAAATKKRSSRALKAGRPRRLQLIQVIDAALAIGLEGLTMAAVAQRLGVAKAVLYGYVGSRDELVRLSTAHASQQHRFPTDTGQSWSMWILEYSRALFELLSMDGQLFESWFSGSQSTKVEVDAAEMWLRVLTRCGFSGTEALQLRSAVSQLVIGAAVSMKHDRVLKKKGKPRSMRAKKAVLGRPPHETALLRQFVDVFAREVTEDNWEHGLYLLLRGVTAARAALRLDRGNYPFEKLKLPSGTAHRD